ncbi:MAG: hypothetical protein HY001_04190 [Candidatus Portnoybacteria bacterium]|nr:hypothetical protein [Candidatus Portnoybacteria bacterium]
MLHNLSPGSYIFSHRDQVLEIGSWKLEIPKDRLHAHPDFYLITSEGSIGIDVIREVGHFLRIKPIASAHKILVVENFHLATVEAQNAFLKTFEEPPPYAYIFLVTPYIDRLLKTIISRAQVITGISNSQFPITKQITNSKFQIQKICKMNVGERFLWLENELKESDDKVRLKVRILEIVDAFLSEGVELAVKKEMNHSRLKGESITFRLKSERDKVRFSAAHLSTKVESIRDFKINLDAVEYLKEAKWKIEQGFPNPKLLVEGFFIKLG